METIKERINNIFKFLETADLSKWNGINVFEASDADKLYTLLESTFKQTYYDGYESGQINEALDCNDILREEFGSDADFEKMTKAKNIFKELIK